MQLDCKKGYFTLELVFECVGICCVKLISDNYMSCRVIFFFLWEKAIEESKTSKVLHVIRLKKKESCIIVCTLY